MKSPIDWSLYLVTDPDLAGGADKVARVVLEAVLGGVGVVQLRDKNADEDEFARRALQIRSILTRFPYVPIFVNDRFDCALKHGFHLHIGQHDMPYVDARKALPQNQMIGLSIENMQQLENVLEQCSIKHLALPDVVGIGPVWDTPTKTDTAQALGVSETIAIAQKARTCGIAAVAIGGITQQRAALLAHKDISGICVVSAIMSSKNPLKTAQNLQNVLYQSSYKVNESMD